MEQTSKLSIVVDTRTAEGQLKSFRQNLREVEQYGKNMDKSLTNIGSKTQFAGLVASIKSAQSTLLAFSGTAKNSVSAMEAFNVTAKNLSANTKNIASNLNTSQAAMARFANSSKSVGTNLQTTNAAISQTQTNLMKIIGSFNFATTASSKLSASAKILKADIAALNAALATGSGSLGRFGQASNAAGAASGAAKARNTELANSYRLVNTGLQSNAQFLQQANKALNANSSASVAAKLNQDKLSISSSKVATAASRAAEASTRAQIATVNLANASSRASAAISDEASAASRAAAANSNAAAAATRAASATSNLAAANSRAAAASSGASAAASRAAGASSSAAAAASRAAAAVSGEAAARERATAAASRAAAAAANAAAAQDRASTAALRLAAAEARAAADADRLSGALNRTNAQGRGLMGTLTSLQGVLMGSLGSLAGFGILKTADEMQNLNSQIKLVTNSTGEFLGVREKVREIADKNFNDVSATTNLYQKSATALANLGKSQQEALIFTDAVSLAMRTGGRSAQEQASAILQLGQAMGAGALMGDEFRSIAENAPILLELVSKRMGVLPGQLKELASEGKITSEIMYDAFSQNVSLLEDMAKKMPLTMSQAFVVAKNDYKKFVDGMMNDTGGASSKIAGFITGVSGNFDTLAKVAIAGVGLAFANMALSIGSASTAMAIFNAVAGLNPLILIAGGFLAVTSAIYGTNDVLTLSGVMIGDLMGELGDMANFLGNTWNDVSNWIMENVFQVEKAISDSNDKNRKSYFGFYEETEKGFAGLVQRIMGNIASVGALTGTMITYYQTFVDNLIVSVTNLTTAFSNLYKMGANLFGGDEKLGDFQNYKTMDVLQMYRNQNSSNQDTVANYVRGANQRAGTADPTYSNPLRSRYFKSGFGDLMTPGANSVLRNNGTIPSNLRAPNSQISTEPMDMIKKQQYDQLKAQEAITAATKEREKLAKAQAKADKALGIKNLGNGYVSNTNLKGLPLKGGIGGQATAGGKIKGYTAEFAQAAYAGMANDIKYFSGFNDKFHAGTSSKHATGSAFDLVLKDPSQAKKAAAALREYADQYGYSVKILDEYANPSKNATGGHLHVSVTGRKKGSVAGGIDLDYLKQVNSDQAKEAAKAEKERIKEAEEAQKEQDRIANLRLKLIKDYGDKQLQLEIENDERVAEIKDAGFNSTKQAELIEQSKQQMDRELAVYKKGLEDKVNELVKFQQTERDLLKKQYDDNVFSLVSDSELSRPENTERLKQAIINAKTLYEYNVSMYESALEQQKDAMYAFQKTERQILLDGWDNKLADAENQYDELRDYRISALVAEGRQEISIFDTNQSLKMLELKKSHMSAMQYIMERYALEQQLINSSNETPETKALQLEALRDPAKVALKDMLGGIEQQSPMARIQAEYEANLLIIEEYEQKYTDMIGVQTEARLAVEQSYMDAKRDLMLSQGEAIFGNLAGLSKAFLGEQSSLYKGLFAIEKAYTLATVLLKNKEAIAKAWASAPFPYNIPAVATTVAGTAGLASAVSGLMPKGFKQGGYTGNMGVNQVAGAVHGQEYVFDAQSTKRIGVDNLNAMRSGRAANDDSKVNINIINNSSAKVTASDDGQTITIEDVRNENKRSWSNLSNPNSYESKQVNRNVQAPRRR